MKIGYARVSTEDQNLEHQLQVLHEAECKKVYKEKISGIHQQRPELIRLLNELREDDILIVWRLDRLARSTRDLLNIVETVRQAKAHFRSLSEPWADTTSYSGRMLMTLFAGIAEFERELILERTATGRAAAQKRGVRFGRPLKINNDQRNLITRLMAEGSSVKQIAKTLSVNPSTIYRAIAP